MTLQEELITWENLTLAYENAARGKRGRGATATFEYDLADQLLQLEAELSEQTYQPGDYHSFYIHEPKKRLISAAPFRDRVVHHALCNVTTPYFERLFIANSFANRIGKGTHRALDACQQYAKNYRYVLQCDVVQFFPSIDHVVLRQILLRMLPDKSVDWLVDRILASGQDVLSAEYEMVYFPGDDLLDAARPRGLPIGNLTSQWWANCYLNPFDHFVRRQLGCPAYLRYVDDFLLFGNDKKELMDWRDAIVERLERFRLTLHSGSAHPHPVTNGTPFLGFIIFPHHRRLKARKGYAFRRKIWHLIKTSDQKTIRSSLQGWLNHVQYGDTYHLRQNLLAELGLQFG
ncbi:MAG: reverse transcriptase/maturase family protein [Anaerolineaceae bacterium]|nr:reverse transcriptase/maturase family protein [Anaerolineaceae bacterium]